MHNSIQILFKDYNNFIIPYEQDGDRKILILNSSHASLTTDSKLYDESLKITFHLDSKEWTVRDEHIERTTLNLPKLERFLITELKKYDLPTTKNRKKNHNTIRVLVQDYYLPEIKEVVDNFEETRMYSMKTIEILKKIGGLEALNFVQITQKKAIDDIPNGLGKNLSDNSLCKMAFNSAEKVAKFIINKKAKKTSVCLSNGKYYINLILVKDNINN